MFFVRVTCVSLFYHFDKILAHYGSLVVGGKPIVGRLVHFLRETMADFIQVDDAI